MGPYTKQFDKSEDAWEILDAHGHNIANLETETMADKMIAALEQRPTARELHLYFALRALHEDLKEADDTVNEETGDEYSTCKLAREMLGKYEESFLSVSTDHLVMADNGDVLRLDVNVLYTECDCGPATHNPCSWCFAHGRRTPNDPPVE